MDKPGALSITGVRGHSFLAPRTGGMEFPELILRVIPRVRTAP